MLKSIWNKSLPIRKNLTLVGAGSCMLFLGLCSACKSKKVVVAKNESTEKIALIASNKVLSEIKEHQLSFKTFSAKAKSALSLNTDYYDASLTIRIKNNQAIWISITTILGLEAARVFITPERFKMMNRLNGTYVDKPFSFIHRFSSSEISYEDLQALLVGNLISQAFYASSAEQNNLGYALKGKSEVLSFYIQTNGEFRPISNELRVMAKNQQVRSNYTDFTDFNNQSVAKTVVISATDNKLKLDMQIKYSQIALNEPIELPFNIPTKYKEIN